MVKGKKKPVKKTTPRRSVPSKQKSLKDTSLAINHKAHWQAYESLQKKVDKAWAKLQADVQRKAPANVLVQNKNELLLLLGECNYMARECMRVSSNSKSNK